MSAALVFALLLTAQASQPPAPAEAPQGQNQQTQAQARGEDGEQNSPTPPVPVPNEGIVVQQDSGPNNDAGTQNTQAATEWWRSAEALSTIAVAIFTCALLFVAYLQLRFNWRMEAHQKSIERAYVGMTNYPPGLLVQLFSHSSSTDPIEKRDCYIALQIRNHGNTPGRVTATFATDYADIDLPQNPPYEQPNGVKAFLVKDGEVRMHVKFSMPTESLNKVHRGEIGFWIIGFVDYIDCFGQRHRSGYARRIRQTSSGRTSDPGGFECWVHELDFELKRGYNYDRERQQGEGDDWSEPT